MFFIVLRKLVKNKWLTACLLVGCVIAVAVISSIPVYSDAILQRTLLKDLQNMQTAGNVYPGRLVLGADLSSGGKDQFWSLDNKVCRGLIPDLGLDVLAGTRMVELQGMRGSWTLQQDWATRTPMAALSSMEGLEDHIKLLTGRMPSAQAQDGVYEALVTQKAFDYNEWKLGETYTLSNLMDMEKKPVYRFKVVGIFTIADPSDPFWVKGLDDYQSNAFLPYSLFCSDMLSEDDAASAWWGYTLNYNQLSVAKAGDFLTSIDHYSGFFQKDKMDVPAYEVLQQYQQRSRDLTRVLWLLQIPLILMLLLYIFMVSRISTGYDQAELALLKSRGASAWQVIRLYLLQSLLIAAPSLLIGPWVGKGICGVIGSSNGFLDFVSRVGLPVSLGPKAFLYGGIAAAVFLLTMLLPPVLSQRTSIVAQKRSKGEKRRIPLWKKAGLDFICLGVSLYGLYTYHTRQKVLLSTGTASSSVPVDPLIFMISTLFLIGAGLLFLRLFPLAVGLIYRVGRRWWTPVLYTSLINVSRSKGQNQFFMLFLILTLAMGIFNASSARSLNSNAENKIQYANGADLVITSHWIGIDRNGSAVTDTENYHGSLHYQEPPFAPFANLGGISAVTRVFRRDDAQASGAKKSANQVSVMGIEPGSFGQAAWFRRDLLPYSVYDYLKLMENDPRAALASSGLRDTLGLKEGDTLYLRWGDRQEYTELTVYAFIDYWPTYDSTPTQQNAEGRQLVVANLSTLYGEHQMEPYEVWMKMKPDATEAQVYQSISNSGASVETLVNSRDQITRVKNDPVLQGTNGTLTLSFLITMFVSMAGFLIYWIFDVKSRVLQFGILRSMGMSKYKLTAILFWEQLLMSVTSVLMGVVIGGIAAQLFVPLLQLSSDLTAQVPPFRVVALRSDYLKVYAFAGGMLAVGMGVFSWIVAKININQALKLGED